MDLWYSLTSQFGTPAVIIAIGLIALGVYSIFFSGKGKGGQSGNSGRSTGSSSSSSTPPSPPPSSPGV